MGSAGPCSTVAGVGAAAQDVPQAGHKVSAHCDEYGELYQTQQEGSEGGGEG